MSTPYQILTSLFFSFVSKSDFKELKHVEEADEEFVICVLCERKFHERCVLHNKSVVFCCKNCRAISTQTIAEMKLSAEDLPTTECDVFIMRHFEKCGLSMPMKLIVRMVSNVEKKLEVKPSIAKYRKNAQITYNNCSLFAFFKTKEGKEISFFGCYFQLYSSNCEAQSNINCAYLSYIDSVNLFNVPERSKTYQHLLIALFDYFKLKNFSKIFVWSCPPKRAIDYIFLEKPAGMKIPTPERLVAWYLKLFALSKEANVIESFVSVDEFAHTHGWKNLDKVPYFEGDLWPLRIKEAVITAEKNGKWAAQDIEERIWELMQVQTIGFDDQYFILFVNQQDGAIAKLPPTIDCHFTNDRADLVDFFIDRKMEFSDERLAMFSSFQLLYSMLADASRCLTCKKVAQLDVSITI
jgi:hypothetical protein